jgi:NAD(P)-dependent dehydrogenase (short-subunit alcohol dehydrogenase family)
LVATSALVIVGRVDLRLNGHVVLVVGGTGLIGRAVVERLRAEGATAIAASRHAENGIVLDARDPDSVAAAFAGIQQRYGRLDALVVAAAPHAGTLDPSRSTDPEQVLAAIDAKAMTFLRLANAALPPMTAAGYGRIVGVCGQNAFLTGNLTGTLRNATVILAAKNLADAVAGSGITVNTVSPGRVSPTPAAEVETGTGGESSPGQIADLITFLVSPPAAAISGESIAIGHRVRGVTSM